MRMHLRWLAAGTLALSLTGCENLLEVKNTNNPETTRVLASPADVEKLIGDSFASWFFAVSGNAGINMQMQAASFEISPMAANFGMIERSAIPRSSPNNTTSDAYNGQYYYSWSQNYKAIRGAADGLGRLAAGVSVGDAVANARATAWAKLIIGLSHGALATAYDSILVVDETTDLSTVSFVDAATGMTAALGYIDEAIAIANANPTMSIDWANGVTLDGPGLVRLARSYKAKYRAAVARTPAETVDWALVLADAQNGITADFLIESDADIWLNYPSVYHSFYGAWNQLNYFYMGMADTSGAFQTWLAVTPITSRMPFVVATPDTRWPRGTTGTAQIAAPGSVIANKGTSGHVRSDRGTWRWSFYQNRRYQAYYSAGWLGDYPLVLRSELDFLEAEAHIEMGNPASAVTIVNTYRAQGGLPAVTTAGTTVAQSCVPRLPNGTCADLLEAMKYEKRLATMYIAFGGWFTDARRWGDLIGNTAVDYPVPARELEVLGLPLYTRGGGRPGSAAASQYGFVF